MSGSMDMTIRLATEPKEINKTIDKIGEDRNDKLESGAG
jgi:tryptophanyl-tRNA synthetase